MSASLVGSEMCIRDRAFGICRGRQSPSAKVLQPANFQVALAASELRVLSVSYTHLTLPTICSV
eukprot:14577796-Alexandrium_andersonii.AAC.1